MWHRMYCGEKAREERGGGGRGQGWRGGNSHQMVERHALQWGDQAHLEATRRSTGLRAASTQGTGLMQRLPKKKGGGVPQVGRGIRFNGRGGGEGLTQHSCPTAKVDPKWA